MHTRDLLTLFGHSYWATRQVLRAAAALAPAEWGAESALTTRGLRATLVHMLDVESSWRLRLQRRPKAEWDAELAPVDYPDAAALAAHWARDEAAMLDWIASLDEAALHAPWSDSREKQGQPLWYFLMHILTHSQQQRADAAMLLTRAGHSPGDLDFLNYADTLA